EITLEVNPEDLTETNLAAWQALGINRLSIGVQTMNNELLAWMNRNHRAADTCKGLNYCNRMLFRFRWILSLACPNKRKQI
ncbi:MAG: coproporphyrinogen III oxidase, partial [Flavobacteriia bacterium]|nr:coproporphyrinogen III oxidase [Flavobacteriia bacterium]